MRVKVLSQVLEKRLKEQQKDKYMKRKRKVHHNLSGRIAIKELDGRSYMKRRFYNKAPLETDHIKIMTLNAEEEEQVQARRIISQGSREERKAPQQDLAIFEFKTR